MVSTPYSFLYDIVLSKVKDYDLASLSQDEVYDILFDYIRPAIVRFKSSRNDLSVRDDELQQFNFKLSDIELEILGLLMVCEYLDANYIRVSDKMKTMLPSKDFNSFSNANLLKEVRSTRQSYLNEATQLMRDYSYVNSTLFKK